VREVHTRQPEKRQHPNLQAKKQSAAGGGRPVTAAGGSAFHGLRSL